MQRSVGVGAVVGLATALGAAIWIVFAALDVAIGAEDVRELVALGSLERTIAASCTAIAVVTGVLCIGRWRLVGDAASFGSGLAMIILGVTVVGFTDTVVPHLPHGYATDAAVLAVGPVGAITALGAMFGSLWLPAVDNRLRFWRSLLVAFVVVAAGTATLQGFPDLVRVLSGGTPAVHAVTALLWASLAWGFARDAQVNQRDVAVWVSAFALCNGQGRLAMVLVGTFGSTWAVAADVFRLLAFLIALVGAIRTQQDTGKLQNARLLDSLASARARAELDHDLRSALLAIDGAAVTLERHMGRLASDECAQLVRSLSSEIARIQRLVSGEGMTMTTFSVADVVRPLSLCDAARGTNVDVGGPAWPTATAVGSPEATAEIVRNLLDNARIHGQGDDVAVLVVDAGDEVHVRVEDCGPGLPRGAHELAFQRGWRGTGGDGPPGSGLGLAAARRLAQEQGGRMWAEDRPGGGAAFVLALRNGSRGQG